MKKTTRIVFAALSAFMLVGCGASQGLADKINAAAKTDDDHKDDYTAEKLIKKLGDPTFNATLTALGSTNGVMIWVNGAKDGADARAKNEAGKEQKALTVTILNNYAVSASFDVWTGAEK